jgi:hypothetical protein
VQNADADRIRTRTTILWSIIVPADGNTAATVGNGDSGTSPFFGQLADKPKLAYYSYRLSDAKHNSGSQKFSSE